MCSCFFLWSACWTHENRKLSLQQSCADKLGRYCCKSLSLYWQNLFAKDIYITNVRFKSILGLHKCQTGNIFKGFFALKIHLLQSSEIHIWFTPWYLTSFGPETWPTNRYIHWLYCWEMFCKIWRTGCQIQAFFNCLTYQN